MRISTVKSLRAGRVMGRALALLSILAAVGGWPAAVPPSAVAAISDLQVTNSAPATATVGTNFQYTLTVTNNTPDAVPAVDLVDTLPDSTTFVSATATQGPCFLSPVYLEQQIGCLIGSIASGVTVTVTITVSPTAPGNAINSAGVTFFSPVTATTSISGGTSKPLANLEITKTGPATAALGDTINYTVGVTNHGPDTATNPRIQDLLPLNVDFVSGSAGCAPLNGSIGNSTSMVDVRCSLANLAAGASTSVTITAHIHNSLNGATSINNAADARSDAVDLDTWLNFAFFGTAITAPTVDLTLTKTAPATVFLHKAFSYTLNITNGGTGSATGVALTDALPAGVKLKTASAGCSGTTTVTCNIGSLASGATTVLTITVQAISSGTVTNAASVSLNETDANPADNTASASTMIAPHHP